MAERKQIGFAAELVAQIDTVAAAVGQSRTEWATQAIEERLAQPRSHQRMQTSLRGAGKMEPPVPRPALPDRVVSSAAAKRRSRPAIPKASKRG